MRFSAEVAFYAVCGKFSLSKDRLNGHGPTGPCWKRNRKMNRSYCVLSVLALSLSSQAVLAQETLDLGDITVSANLADTQVSRTGASVVVVTRDDLQKTNDIRVEDFLNRLPGISVNSNGPVGTASGISIRGANQNYVAVFIDGIDVTDPSGTQVAYDFGGLTTADIARIEVLKGSQSALYGGEAVGGVINITTSRAEQPGTSQSVNLEYGSFNTVQGSYSIARMSDRYAVSATLSRIRTDGFSAADENNGNPEADGYDQTKLSFSGEFYASDAVTLGLSGFVQKSTTEFDDFVGGAFSYGDGTPDDKVRKRSYGLRAYSEFSTGMVDNTIDLTSYRIERKFSGTDSFGAYSWNYEGKRTGASYQGVARLSAVSTLVFGADVANEEYFSDTGFGPTSGSTTIGGGFVQWLGAPGDQLDIGATLRLDRHSSFGDFPTGRLTVAWRPDAGLVVRAAAYTGFRAPSYNELFGPFGGNPALKPEESRGVELGVEKQFANGASASATGFHLETSDLIQYVFPGYVQVAGTSRRKGVEMSFAMPISERMDLRANYTFIDSSDSTGAQLSRVPMRDLSVSLAADLTDRLRGSVDWQFVSGRVDSGTDMPDYSVANLSISYDLGEQTQLYLRVENLFDQQYQTVRNFGTSDRAVYAGFRKSF
jgi:vitamin B12 transporter